jgi:hypothetical protein
MNAVDRLLGLLVGLVLFGAGGLLVVEVVQAVAGQDPWVDWPSWVGTLRSTGFADTGAVAGFAAAVVAGIVLLALEIRRRPPARVRLDEATGAWWLRRRSLEQFLAGTVRSRTPARSAAVRVRPGHKLTAEVEMHAGHPDTGPESCLLETLDRLRLHDPLRVQVRTNLPETAQRGRS